MRISLCFALFVIALSVVCCGGGGGGGPTAPAAVPLVSGSWIGDWATAGLLLHPTLFLTQSGDALQGSFTLLGTTINITGNVNASLGMNWTAVNGGCGSLTGDGLANNLSPSQITGNINLDTTGCPSPGHFQGPVVWRRSSASAMTNSEGSIEGLARRLREGKP